MSGLLSWIVQVGLYFKLNLIRRYHPTGLQIAVDCEVLKSNLYSVWAEWLLFFFNCRPHTRRNFQIFIDIANSDICWFGALSGRLSCWWSCVRCMYRVLQPTYATWHNCSTCALLSIEECSKIEMMLAEFLKFEQTLWMEQFRTGRQREFLSAAEDAADDVCFFCILCIQNCRSCVLCYWQQTYCRLRLLNFFGDFIHS